MVAVIVGGAIAAAIIVILYQLAKMAAQDRDWDAADQRQEEENIDAEIDEWLAGGR